MGLDYKQIQRDMFFLSDLDNILYSIEFISKSSFSLSYFKVKYSRTIEGFYQEEKSNTTNFPPKRIDKKTYTEALTQKIFELKTKPKHGVYFRL